VLTSFSKSSLLQNFLGNFSFILVIGLRSLGCSLVFRSCLPAVIQCVVIVCYVNILELCNCIIFQSFAVQSTADRYPSLLVVRLLSLHMLFYTDVIWPSGICFKHNDDGGFFVCGCYCAAKNATTAQPMSALCIQRIVEALNFDYGQFRHKYYVNFKSKLLVKSLLDFHSTQRSRM